MFDVITQTNTNQNHSKALKRPPWVKRLLGKREVPGSEPRDPHKGLVSVTPALTARWDGGSREEPHRFASLCLKTS